jgi:hypothetical protein
MKACGAFLVAAAVAAYVMWPQGDTVERERIDIVNTAPVKSDPTPHPLSRPAFWGLRPYSEPVVVPVTRRPEVQPPVEQTTVPLAADAGTVARDPQKELERTNLERRPHAAAQDHGKPRYYRKRPLQVDIKAMRRRGGYSYRAGDVIGTYGQSYVDTRQTPSGPFDHGFFFDSGIGPHGGNSPYLH